MNHEDRMKKLKELYDMAITQEDVTAGLAVVNAFACEAQMAPKQEVV
jgi:hypothetical protein